MMFLPTVINRFCLPSGERIDCSREARSTPREWFKPQRSEDLNKELSGCGSAEASYDRQPERSNKTQKHRPRSGSSQEQWTLAREKEVV
jgi:hypothetical protein